MKQVQKKGGNKVVESVSVLLVSIAAVLTAIDQISMAEKDKDEAVNELNGNSVGYLGYQK